MGRREPLDERTLGLSQARRALLAPAFGAAIALSFALGWLALDRAFTARVLAAIGYFAVAGTLSAAVALFMAYTMRKRATSARVAAATIVLLAGTAGLAALFMTLGDVLRFHDLSEVPIGIALLVLGLSGAGAFYNVLAIAAPITLPLGLLAVALFVVLIARDPR